VASVFVAIVAAQPRHFSVVEVSIADMQRALKQRRVTSHELVQQYLTRIALYEDRLILVVEPGHPFAGEGRIRMKDLAEEQLVQFDLPAAIDTLDTIARRGLADQSVLVVLAGYLQEGGALARSAEMLEAVVTAHPDYADAYNSLGVAYSRMRERGRARAAFQKVLELDPTSATAYENLGVDALSAGDFGAAVEMLTRALELDPALAAGHNALATALLRQGHRAEALEHWRMAVQLNPRFYDALYNLGTVLYADGQRAEARPLLERFVAEAPPARYARDIAYIRGVLTR